jgi:hypothetical protein
MWRSHRIDMRQLVPHIHVVPECVISLYMEPRYYIEQCPDGCGTAHLILTAKSYGDLLTSQVP